MEFFGAPSECARPDPSRSVHSLTQSCALVVEVKMYMNGSGLSQLKTITNGVLDGPAVEPGFTLRVKVCKRRRRCRVAQVGCLDRRTNSQIVIVAKIHLKLH